MLNRTLPSSLLAGFVWLAGIAPAGADIIPKPIMSPTPTIPPVIGPLPTATPAPTPIATPSVARPSPTPRPTVPASPTPVATPTSPLQNADPQLARAIVRYGQNASAALANDRGRFQKVALQPDQVITIVLTLSPADYGKPAEVQVLDGGAMTTAVPKKKDVLPSITPFPTPTIAAVPINSATNAAPTIPPSTELSPSSLVESGALMTVSQAGEVVFAFKPGADIGLHRVSVIVGGNQYFLQFWRQDMNNQANNPRMLRAY